MASLQAWFWYYACSIYAYKKRNLTEEEHLEEIASKHVEANAPQRLPPALYSDPNVDIKEEVFDGPPGHDPWQTFTFTSKVKETNKVILYFHGGGFVKPADDREYAMAFRITQDLHHTVIHPSWTLAPQSCALEFPAMAVKHLLSIADDPQYEGKEIWLGGLSAGGWCALRLLLALCEEALDSKDDARRSRLNAVLDRIPGIFLFCPSVTLEMDDEAKRLGNLDPLLTSPLVDRYAKLWCYGGAQYPVFYDRLPESLQEKARAYAKATEGTTLLDPRFSISNKVDTLREYVQHSGRSRPFIISSFIGSYDILYPGLRDMHRKLSAMDKSVVKEDLTIAPGSGHAYMVMPMPETDQVWRRMRELLA